MRLSRPAGGGPSGGDEGDDAAALRWPAPAPGGFGPDVAGTRPYIDRLRAKSPATRRDHPARHPAASPRHPDEVPIP
ncbi:hypothetical protein [Streptomyces sp. NRRL B-24572]|uniref:hypothetical protein n=1 Tax=Streptomyces sp. NRRL B-24572 TaxID=1962156 RepID=UPI000A3C59A7|nr:hypothetical protein [Streptomyces sp. NRRL B-24572]